MTPTKPVALAPNNIDMHHYEEEWLPILENIDILIPFAFARSEYNVAEIAAMCRKTGTHFWVDPENRIAAIYMKNSRHDGGGDAITSAEFEEDVTNALKG